LNFSSTMPLNYSKWDQLELSDDSDIEGHPNVDHKSLVRMMQRSIHEKRDERKQRIAHLRAEIDCNDVLLPRLDTIVKDVEAGGPSYFSSLVERLKTNPSPDKPDTPSPNQPTYDAMLEASLVKVWQDVKEKGITKNDNQLGDALVQGLKDHIDEFRAHHKHLHEELESELKEQSKKITSDDIHEGFSSKYVPAKPEPEPLVPESKKKHQTKKETPVEYEVLNPKGVSSSSSAQPTATESDDDADDEDNADALPEMNDELRAFAKLPIGDYETIFRFIQNHRSVYVPGASDALLVEGFQSESKGNHKYAKQCVHQSLVLQYCERLGKDGVGVFFKRMMTKSSPQAEAVFRKDFEDTYAHMKKRVAIVKAEDKEISEKGGKEQIQLVAADPSQTIGFNVPDGPPPEHLELEGPGTEDLDVEEVRKALQLRWDIFSGFSPKLQKALKSGNLVAVNKVLGVMSVDEAEGVVQSLQIGGILRFADEGKVRDATGGNAPVQE